MNKIVVYLLIIVAAIFGAFFIKKTIFKPLSVIEGTIHFDRLKPDPGDKGNLFVMYRPYQSKDNFKETGVISNLQDNVQWSWAMADKGATYELVAQLRIDGKIVKTSDTIVASAPAIDQVLTVTITWDDLPDYIVKDQSVAMGGTVRVDGYIPAGSVLSVMTKQDTETEYTSQWSSNSPKSSNGWLWEKATPKAKYQIKALLTVTDRLIGESSPMTELGLDTTDIDFSITSTEKIIEPTKAPQATAVPVQKASIRGSLIINGPLVADTSALIMWSPPGQNKWTEITRLKNLVNGSQSWEWSDVRLGIAYEMTVALQVNENNIATAQNKTVTAPSNDVSFTINTGVNIQTPSNKPTLDSCTNNNNNQWDANIVLPVNSSYGSYWLQVGTSKGGTQVYNDKMKGPTNDNYVRLSTRVNNAQSYFVRYAYSLCANCSSDANFSNFSDSQEINCGGQPAPTATPTLAPNTSRCNETCGSNGYTCVLGLQCVSTDMPGQSACRNPNCTDRSNCSCL